MKLAVIAVGKTDPQWAELVDEFLKRIEHFCKTDLIVTTDEKLLSQCEKYTRVFLLDEHGAEFTSKSFAGFLQKQLNSGVQSVALVLGGAYGFSDALKARADGLITLSKLTFPHQLARLILLEQIYRGFTILNNQKYHHE
jgi:23S rRNA (pseudouridine1915-N3)-methyltransferase